MNIEKLFSSKERVNILESVIFLEGQFGVNETAKKLKLSKGLISKYFEILIKEGVLKKKANKFIVSDNIKVKSIKILLNIKKVDINVYKKYKFIRAVGLYGSCAKGTNTVSSDVDLWIKVVRVSDEEIAELTSGLRKQIENVKLLILDNKKLELLKNKDTLFYHSLYFGSIILFGSENEI